MRLSRGWTFVTSGPKLVSMKTTSTVIADLAAAFDAAQASGTLIQDSETGAWLLFRVPLDEFESLPGDEVIADDSPEPFRFKHVYSAGDFTIVARPAS